MTLPASLLLRVLKNEGADGLGFIPELSLRAHGVMMKDFVSNTTERTVAAPGLTLSGVTATGRSSLICSTVAAPAAGGGISQALAIARGTHSGYALAGKRLLDLALVLLALPVALPIILLSAVMLWLESGLPFYSQDRLGQHGKSFRIFKLRTMVRDADARLQSFLESDPELRHEWETTQKLKHDPRITRVGRFLRMTSLDELPQLWNVATGTMSLVGPRPMLPEQLSLYGEATAYFAVKPGITGVWQVSTRNESSFASRAKADADYLRQMGLQQDLSLIWRTVGVVAKGTGY
nr:sugar transferase [Pseudophaeobacter arcticus]